MNKSLKIADRLIGTEHPPFIIAEMSGNHNQSLERALEIVDAAAKSGVHAIKLQTYTADTMTIDCDRGAFYIDDPTSLWKGESLYNLYQKAHTPWEWHEPIFSRCRELGLIAFSTPFDETSVDFLESLNVPAYKIASFENNHLPLIEKVALTGKPLIISTGVATIAEIDEAVRTAVEAGCNDILLLKCTSNYPSSPEDSNLVTIPHMKQLFNTEVGISDHTLGIGVSIAGVALGATMIEKHFTLKRSDGGVDSAFSLEPNEMNILVKEAYKAWHAIGSVCYSATEQEKKSAIFKRSVYVVKDIKKGDVFSSNNIRIIRPSGGLSPKYYKVLAGKKAAIDIECGVPMKWEYVT